MRTASNGNNCVLYCTHLSKMGGGETLLLTFATSLPPDWWRSVILCPGESELSQRATRLGLPVVSQDTADLPKLMGRIPLLPLTQVARTARTLKNYQVDLVQAHSYPALRIVGLAARLLGIPVVLTWQHFRPPTPRQAWIINLLADRVVAPSRYVADRLLALQRIASKKVCVVANGIDQAFFERPEDRLSLRTELGIPSDAYLIGCVARLEPEKGQDDLIKAFAAAAQSDWHLLIVGANLFAQHTQSAYERQLAELVAENNLDGQVHFTSYLEDVIPAYDALDVFVLASHGEAFGLAVAEAMARGKPVIVTHCGGTAELVEEGNSGFCVAPGNWEAIAARLKLLDNNPGLRAKLGQAGRARAGGLFRAERMLQQTLQIYDDLIGARTSCASAGDYER